jgi:hypothetical protein
MRKVNHKEKLNNLDEILEELKSREPIFHQAEYCSTREKLEQYTAKDFWEVGASGKVYDRQTVIDTVEKRFKEKTEPDTNRWQTSDFKCRSLGNDTYLVTYLLKQADRITRRLTIWRKTDDQWQVAYHQGTIVSDLRPNS